jgi:hypothetical protein
MATQNYANHRQSIAGYHLVLLPILLLTFVGACVNLGKSVGDHQRLYSAALLVVLAGAAIAAAIYGRVFALKAQDRAIYAQENLRHYILTGKPLSPALTVLQVVGLRFASDEEFASLAARAVKEQLKPDDIKRAIQNWRPDTYRV